MLKSRIYGSEEIIKSAPWRYRKNAYENAHPCAVDNVRDNEQHRAPQAEHPYRIREWLFCNQSDRNKTVSQNKKQTVRCTACRDCSELHAAVTHIEMGLPKPIR